MRHTGIDVIGDVQWGTHFCQFYEGSQDLIETLVPYFKEGLASNEFCMWVTSEPLGVRQAKAALRKAVPDLDNYVRKGQIEIIDYKKWYICDGKFSADEVLKGWVDKLRVAVVKGFEGLRLSGNTFWLEQAHWEDFRRYEETINGVIGQYKMLAMCTYSLKKCGAKEILDVAANHEFALIKRQGRWEIIKSTAQQQTEQELKQALDFSTAVLDTAGALVVVLDREGRITRFNRACEALTGYSEAEVLGRIFWEFLVPEEDLAGVKRTWEGLKAGDFPNKYENKWVARDSSKRLIAWSNTAMVHPDGKVEYIIGTGIDITEPRKAEASIKYQALLLGQVHDAIAGTDPDTRITYWNKGAEHMYGFTEEEALGRRTRDLLKPVYSPGEREKILDDLARSGVSEATIPTRHKNGTEVIAEVHSTRMADETGATSGYVVAYRDVTERKIAEEELRRTRAHLENLIDYANAPIIVWDPSFKITRFNHAFERLTGLRADEVIGRPLDILFPEESCEVSLAHIKRTLAGERWEVVEIPILKADGSVRTVLWNSANVYAEDGVTITATIAQGQDITERKAAEEELRRQSEELRRVNRTLTALSHSDQALMHAKSEKEFLQEACQIIVRDCGHAMVWIGFAEDDKEKSVRPVAFAGFEDGYVDSLNVSWDDTERGRGPTGTAIRTGKPCACTNMMTDPTFAPWRKQAIARGYGSSVVLPLLADGKAFGSISIYFCQPGTVSEDEMRLLTELANDVAYGITSIRLREAHARAEHDLQLRSQELQKLTETLEHRLVTAVGQVKEGMAIMDAAGRIEYFNPAFEKTSGLGRADLLGKLYYELLVGEGVDPSLPKQARKTVERGESWNAHLARKHTGEQTCELDISIAPIRDRSGNIINYVVVERDVTQEVRIQQHLRQTQKMEALGTLAGGIAHDFNNILNPIFINTELVLMDAALDHVARRDLETVLKAAERGRDLVKQIITFSRQKEKERKPSKVGPVIAEALKFLRSSLPVTIEIRQKIDPESGFILADASQIHQVVMNLGNNAAYAMQEKGGILDVSLAEVEVDRDMALRHPDLKPGPYLRLTVSDTGKGMTQKVMERAFDPFFTTKKHGEGAGMGLAMVHGIVRDYDGAVTVYSEVGKGTTFNVFFPRVMTGEIRAEGKVEGLPRGTERILLVDDERTQAQSIRNMLKRLGYEVEVKTDAEEALATFGKDPGQFDLVITDQIMPRLTGVQLAARLLELRPGLPIILCTGFSENVDSDGARAMGIRGFLMKPFSIREMAGVIRKTLGE